MFKFFDFLTGMIETIVGFVLATFEIIIYVFSFIIQGFSYIVVCIGYLPTWVAPFVLAIVSYSIIITVLNKGE